MTAKIKPQTLKGFRDFLPDQMRIREKVINTFKKGFEKYGYEPLETPALEYAEILLGKYGEEAEKLIYQFTDRGGRKVAMKYDLTVPTCRVVAQYQNNISLPFKRYQIQPVWRAENTQKGRFREFYQCDADTLGSSSMLADAEFIQMGLEIIDQLGFNNFQAKINNRKFINGLTKYAGVDDSQFYNICVCVDKLEKIGLEKVKQEMIKKGIDKTVIKKIIGIISLQGTNEELTKFLLNKLGNIEEARIGLEELNKIFSYLKSTGVNQNNYQFDLTIIRGLAYYTGPVWEFVVKDGDVGSIAGCGRYDDLINLYLGKKIPATGGSFGIERIIEIVNDRKMFSEKRASQVLVTIFSTELTNQSLELSNQLRQKGISTELYLDDTVKLDKQLKYADRKGIPYVIIIGPEEVKNNQIKLKDMNSGKQITTSVEDIVKKLKDQNSNVKT